VISSVSTPVIELKGFEKIWLEPGQSKSVSFTLTPKLLALLDENMDWVVEPGVFEVMVGHASNDIRLTGEFEVR
jgi:beta-glucosidase